MRDTVGLSMAVGTKGVAVGSPQIFVVDYRGGESQINTYIEKPS